MEHMYDQRLRPGPDRIAVARLSGTALRHAHWTAPSDAETAAAVAELRSITADPELMAETAGILYGYGGPYGPRDRIAAGLAAG